MRNYRFPINLDRFENVIPADTVQRDDGVFIPFTTDNRDCVEFLENWKDGAQVLDQEGIQVPYSVDAVRALGLEPIE